MEKKYKKTVIVGGVAGGATTAARLRRMDEEMEIVMLERGEYISYANCGLPYYIGDKIKNRESLLLQTPEAMRAKLNIDVRVQNEVTAIHKEDKTVTVKNIKTGESYEEAYDALVLATGSSPLKPPIPGIDGLGIFTLWTVPDTDRIKAWMTEKKPTSAAVIGGGFIGLEMAENLHRVGISVKIIEMQGQVMAPLDPEMAGLLHENMEMNGVELILNDGVEAFRPSDSGTSIRLKSGKSVDVDMVILSIGIRPNTALAKEAGIALNGRGGIVTDDRMRTSEADIYAVGDAVETENHTPGTGSRTMVPLAGPANRQARILADVLAGRERSYTGVQGTSVAQVFDHTAACVGLNEKTLITMGKEKEKDYYTVLIDQKSHAGYYPGAVMLTMKLLFDREGKILGAQIVGQDGADKRIDVIAAVMRLRGTVYDLAELECAYAPPYSSAKDPVNMLGFVAQNVLEGLVSFISCEALDRLSREGAADSYMVLDVTEAVEREVFSVPGSYHIPLGQLRQRLSELDREKLIIPYCAIGVRSYNAARILMQNGFTRVRVLEGGTSFYKSMHYKDSALSGSEKSREGRQAEEEMPEAGHMEQDTASRTVRALRQAQAPGTVGEIRIVDCCGLQCPGPIMKVSEALAGMEDGQMLQISATDMGFSRDVEAWCRRTGNTFIAAERKERETVVRIKKGLEDGLKTAPAAAGSHACQTGTQGKTMVVFSGDLDKVLASFIIANGAAAMGRPVTMFFTFWGLNALRRPEKQHVKKSPVEKMFGAMMPRGTKKLKLSKMNMSGMGTAMMKKVMKDKNVDSLEALMKQAMANGVKLVACTMSMDVMGITKEELINGVELAGVASYLGDAEESDVNLFI